MRNIKNLKQALRVKKYIHLSKLNFCSGSFNDLLVVKISVKRMKGDKCNFEFENNDKKIHA